MDQDGTDHVALGAWRDAVLATELASRLTSVALTTSDETDPEDSANIAALAAQAASFAESAAMIARTAAERAAGLLNTPRVDGEKALARAPSLGIDAL